MVFFFTVHSNTQNQYSGTSMTMYPTSTQGYNHAPPPPMYSQQAGYPQYPPPQYPAHVSGGIHPAYPPNPAYAMWWETHNLKKNELFVRYNAEELDVLYIIFQKFKKCIPYILHEGWLNLPGELFFFFLNQNILLHVHVHVRCKQAQTPDVIYFKNKNEFPITYRQEMPCIIQCTFF